VSEAVIYYQYELLIYAAIKYIYLLWMLQAYFRYEDKLTSLVEALQPLLDSSPPNIHKLTSGSLQEKWREWRDAVKPLVTVGESFKMSASTAYWHYSVLSGSFLLLYSNLLHGIISCLQLSIIRKWWKLKYIFINRYDLALHNIKDVVFLVALKSK